MIHRLPVFIEWLRLSFHIQSIQASLFSLKLSHILDQGSKFCCCNPLAQLKDFYCLEDQKAFLHKFQRMIFYNWPPLQHTLLMLMWIDLRYLMLELLSSWMFYHFQFDHKQSMWLLLYWTDFQWLDSPYNHIKQMCFPCRQTCCQI